MIKYVTQSMFVAIIFAIYNKLGKNNNIVYILQKK